MYKDGTDDAEEIRTLIKSSDIVVYMPINNKSFFGYDSDDIRNVVRNNGGIDIRIPVPFFQGYWPESSFVRKDGFTSKIDGMLLDSDNPINLHYFDLVILNSLLLGIDDDFHDKDFFDFYFVQELCKRSIQELYRRESIDNIDVKVATFIEENYQEEKLFYTINHPGKKIIEYICHEIIKNIIGYSDNELEVDTSWVSHQDYPIYKSVTKMFNFDTDGIYKISGKCFSRTEFYLGHVKYIKSIFEDLSGNLLISNKFGDDYIKSRFEELKH